MPPQPGFWDVENNRRLDRLALAEYDRLLQPSHLRSRRVFPATTSYEIDNNREQETQQQPLGPTLTDRAEGSAAALREGQFELRSELQLETDFEIYEDGSETEASFQTAPESPHGEIAQQASERLGGLTTDLVQLSITTPKLHSELPIISVTNYDSDSSTIIFTPPTPGESIMDADEMAEYRQPLNTHDTAETFAVGVDDDDDEDMGESEVEMGFGDSEVEAGEDDLDPDAPPAAPFNPIAMGLKEIGGLARFRVSSYKPGNGVQELVNDDIDRYWQSDGIQPHRLTMTFVKCVEIRALRFYVDYTQDESYTPTRISWFAGTSEHDLHAFATSNLVNPSGWIDVPLTGTGGGEDGNSLMAWVVQMQIIENHQNGKDTHIRAVKVYGFDEQLRAAGATGPSVGREEGQKEFKVDETKDAEANEKAFKDYLRGIELTRSFQDGDPSGTASSLDFMEDPIIR